MHDDSAHPDELLPWYVNGTLEGPERERVEKHLESCRRCRDEAAWLARLREQIKAEGRADAPGELGLRRLMRQVRDSEAKPRARRLQWWQPALAAAVMIIVIQSVLLVRPWQATDTGIVPLGGQPSTAVVQVEFAPTATEAQIREVLQAVDGVIVDGPGALGIYRIRLQGVAPGDADRVAAAVAALRAREGIVVHAAPE